MINTCNSDIACWLDDGETFVVKNPEKFEQVIIPQFFKHSKFSSFVRVSRDITLLPLLYELCERLNRGP